jgi:hypothetical protein
MKKGGEAFVGIDTAKARNAVAVAEAARDGEVRYLGEIDNTAEAAAKVVRTLRRALCEALFLLRSRTHGVWTVPSPARAGPGLYRGRAVTHPESAGRAGEDQPPRCGVAGAVVARQRVDTGVDPGRDPRSGARSGAHSLCCGRGLSPQTPAAVIVLIALRSPFPWQTDLARKASSMVGRSEL